MILSTLASKTRLLVLAADILVAPLAGLAMKTAPNMTSWVAKVKAKSKPITSYYIYQLLR